jgi:hypothetical protein
MEIQIEPGTIVVYRNPMPDELGADGKSVQMKVLEVNGDRAKVEAIVNMTIRPTYIHLLTELKPTDLDEQNR